MKILDVSLFHDGLERNLAMLSRLEKEAVTIETAVAGLVSMEDGLKGEGGNTIRSFYNECHVPFLQFFKVFTTSYAMILKQMDAALNALEPDPSGFIREQFLEGAIEQGLKDIAQFTESLTSETNSIMNQVADIVSLPHLNDNEVQEGIHNAKTKRNSTVTDLNTFDTSQTMALLTIESDLIRMELWLREIESMMNDNLTDIYFQSDVWAGNFGARPLKKELTNRTSQMNSILGKNGEEKTGSVFAEMLTLGALRRMMNPSATRQNVSDVANKSEAPHVKNVSNSENPEEIGSGTIEWQSKDGNHVISKGKTIDYEVAGIRPDSIDLFGHSVKYTVKDGNFMIFKDNPDLHYYTQSAEQGRFNYYAGQATQLTANAIGTGGIFKVLGKIPGAAKIADKANEKVPGSAGVGKAGLSYEIQKNIPIWGEIIGTPIPEKGSKQVILYISEDGDKWPRRVRFDISKDGKVTPNKWEVK